MAIPGTKARDIVYGLSGFDILAGVWMLLAPFMLGYTGIESAFWNSLVCGVAIIALAASTEVDQWYRHAGLNWANVLIGVWLVISPFLLEFSDSYVAKWNYIGIGVLVGVLAFWGALVAPREKV
jgi:hypothetical protein